MQLQHKQLSQPFPKIVKAFRKTWLDIVMLLVVAIIAACGGIHTARLYGDRLNVLTRSQLNGLHSAVMFAAGFGFGKYTCSADDFPELNAFLSSEIYEIPRESYPEFCNDPYPRDYYFYYHYYLLGYMGLMFYFFGVSVNTIYLACILMHVVAMMALYGVFRLGMGVLLSAVGSIYIALSPVYLIMLPSFRDFSKVPFFLASLLIMGILVKRRHNSCSLMIFGVLLAAVIGIGYGFRQDILVCLPPAILVLLFGTTLSIQHPWRNRISSVLVLLVVFFILATPIFKGKRLSGEFVTFHTLLAGLTVSAESNVGLDGSSYDFGFHALDTPVIASVNGHALRTGSNYPIHCFTREYGEVGGRLFREIALTFPADFATRTLATIEHSFSIALDSYVALALTSPPFSESNCNFLTALYELQNPINLWLGWSGLFLAATVILIVAAYSYKRAFFLFFFLCYFGGYPSLLLIFNHLFHLAFVPVFFACMLINFIAKTLLSTLFLQRYFRLFEKFRPALFRSLAFIVALTFLIGVAMYSLRFYQTQQVQAFTNRYSLLHFESLPYSIVRTGDFANLTLDQPIAESTGIPLPKEDGIAQAYLAIHFRSTRRTIAFKLINNNPAFTRPAHIPLDGTGIYYFPVYDCASDPDAIFQSIELNMADISFIEDVSIVQNADVLPLWPFIAIPQNDPDFAAYKTGPLDKYLAMFFAEASSGFGLWPEKAVAAYMHLVQRYPFYSPFSRRALAHAENCNNKQLHIELWEHIGAYMPDLRYAASQWLATQAEAEKEDKNYSESINLYRKVLALTPTELWNLVRIGEIYEIMGNTEEAKNAYQEILLESPEWPTTAKKLDALYEGSLAGDESVSFWKELSEVHPNTVIPHLYLGITFERMGKARDALQAYEQTLELNNNPEALFRSGALQISAGASETGLARMREAAYLEPGIAERIGQKCAELATQAMAQGNTSLAVSLYETAFEIVPANFGYGIRLGELLEDEGAFDRALSTYCHVLEISPESLAAAEKLDTLFQSKAMNEEALLFWRKCCENQPEIVTPCLYLGIALERTGDVEGAVRVYEKVLTVNNAAEALYRLGSLHISNGLLEDGMTMIRTAARQNPELIGSIGKKCADLAIKAVDKNDLSTAISLYEIAVEIAPTDPWHGIHLGELLENGGAFDQAVATYCHVLDITPESPVAAEKLDSLFQREELIKGALPFWRKLCQTHPETITPCLYLGITLERTGDVEGAVQAYEQILTTDDSAEALYRLGALRISDGASETGMAMMRKAAQQSPELAGRIGQRYAELAAQAEKKGDTNQAISLYELASNVAPHDLWHCVHLGELLENTGDFDRAIEIYRHVLETAPESPATAKKLDALFQRMKRDEQALAFWNHLCQTHPETTVPCQYVGITNKRIAGNNAPPQVLPETTDE